MGQRCIKTIHGGEAQPVDYTSKLGNFLTLYGTFNRPLYRSKHWQWGYYLGTGVGYTSLKYNQKNNIDNEYMARTLIYSLQLDYTDNIRWQKSGV